MSPRLRFKRKWKRAEVVQIVKLQKNVEYCTEVKNKA